MSLDQLVVAERNGTLIRLGDVAKTEMGSEDYNSVNWYKGNVAIFMGIEQAPGSNPLTVAKAVRVALKDIEESLPSGLHILLPYDASRYIEDLDQRGGQPLCLKLWRSYSWSFTFH